MNDSVGSDVADANPMVPVPRRSVAARVGKRTFDVVVGAILGIVSLPIVLVLALWSLLRFRAFPFFVHDRVGLHGRLFRCVKIRTLSPDVPASLDKAELREEMVEEGLAAIVRRLHLDELPQVWQVVSGSMSLVGPRPMIPSIGNCWKTTAMRPL